MRTEARRALLLGAWLLALAALGAWAWHGLRIGTDLRSFMPPPRTADQALLLEQIGEGPGSRLLLIALGGGLALDGWRDYKAAGRTWEDRSRNRIFAGVLVTALGLFGLFELNSWGWLLIILAGWLAYDTWQRYIAAGRMMTPTVRNRFLGAGIMAALGLLGSLNWWSAWPLLLIALGVALLTGVIGERSR